MNDNEKQAIEEMAQTIASFMYKDCYDVPFDGMRAVYKSVCEANVVSCMCCKVARGLTSEDYRKQVWISVEERLPTEDKYLTHHNDGLDSLKRLTVAYMTDTIEYTIGCYDGYKWVNQLGNKKINDVVAWKPFELYEAPMMKGGAE